MSQVIDAYLTRFAGSGAETQFERKGGVPACLTRLTTRAIDGQPAARFGSDEQIVVEAEFEVVEKVRDVRLWAWLYSADGTWLVGSSDAEANPDAPRWRDPGTYVSRFVVPAGVLNEGSYQFRFLITKRVAAMKTWDYHDDRMSAFFEVEDTTDYTRSDLGKRKSLLLLPLTADEQRIERVDAVAR